MNCTLGHDNLELRKERWDKYNVERAMLAKDKAARNTLTSEQLENLQCAMKSNAHASNRLQGREAFKELTKKITPSKMKREPNHIAGALRSKVKKQHKLYLEWKE